MPTVGTRPAQGGITFEQFFAAEAQQESGSYTAVNPQSGALGKYQIMPANIPSWSQKYMGVTWTAQQYLGDPAKQEALSRAVLSDYWDQYGARGAASAWYSGNPANNMNYNSVNGGPSIGAYVDSVIGIAMGKPATGGGSTGGTVPTSGPYNGPSTTVDNSVKNKPFQLPGAAVVGSGMGAASAPGVDAVTAPGAEAVSSSGTQALTSPTEQPPAPAAPSVAPSMGSTTTYGTGATGSRGQAVNKALSYLGIPYVFGGGNAAGPTKSAIANGNFNDVGLDCSGLVEAALAGAGISSSHYSYTQLQMGPRTPISQLQPGDLVGMDGGGHIGIYAGNNQIIVADHTGTNVQQRAIGAGDGAYGVSLASLYH
jgi:cell wall-associated NlpC family hydrolase